MSWVLNQEVELKDKINAAMVASSFSVPEPDVKKAVAFWSGLGVLLKRPSGVKKKKDLLCAHSLDTRLEELKKAFSSQELGDFVWALRGGYGFQELIPHLKKIDFKSQKTFMGFSDGTSLHYYLNKSLGLASVHAPHPNWFAGNKNAKISSKIEYLLNNPKSFSPEFKALKKLNSVGGGSSVSAKIVGGNLTTLVSVLGTSYDEGSKSNILFLEEVEEPAYKVNRMLTHLSQSGFLKGVRALVFGHLSHSSKNQEKLIRAVVKRWAEKQSFPVVSGMQAGHIHEKNNPFWLGKKSTLVLDEKPRLLNNV